MVITYRRTSGLFMLLTFAVAALAATVITVAVAGILLIVAVSVAAVALIGRAVLPRRWRHRAIPAVARWPQETIDATVVNATSSSETPNLPRLDDDTR
jgi:hypothetical protein